MNDKLRAKDLKQVAKELKSKDFVVKEVAIKKALSDTSYLFEAQGVCSLIESVSSKKVYSPYFKTLHRLC